MKKIMRYLFIFSCVGIIFVNLQTAELTRDLKVLPELHPISASEKEQPEPLYRMGTSHAITSVDDLVVAIDRDLQNKNTEIVGVMNRDFTFVAQSIKAAQAVLQHDNPASPLIKTYDELDQANQTSQPLRIQLAQAEHLNSVIADLAKKNSEAADKLAARYATFSEQNLKRMRDALVLSDAQIDSIIKRLTDQGQKVAIDNIRVNFTLIRMASVSQIRRIRIQQYQNLIGVLDLLALANKDVKGAAQAINNLKEVESRLHSLDQEIVKLEKELGFYRAGEVPVQTAGSYRDDFNLARLNYLKKQYDAFKEQYTKQMKSKYGSVLSKLIISKENLFRWMKKNPGTTAAIIVGAGVLALTVSAILVPVAFMGKSSQPAPAPQPAAPAAPAQPAPTPQPYVPVMRSTTMPQPSAPLSSPPAPQNNQPGGNGY